MSKAHLTAIGRNKPSVPMRRLASDGLLVGRLLDFGCGRGFDASHYGAESYDQHYEPVMPGGTFDTVVCNFVLNVIESVNERRAVLRVISNMLADSGRAYITVRNDTKKLIGTTSKGTWQALIVLGLPVVTTNSSFTAYEFCKGDEFCSMTEHIRALERLSA